MKRCSALLAAALALGAGQVTAALAGPGDDPGRATSSPTTTTVPAAPAVVPSTAAAVGPPGIATTGPRVPLSLGKAIQIAISRSPTLTAARHQLAAIAAKRKSVRGALLPQISIESNLIVWDDEQVFPMPDLGDTPVPPPFDQLLAAFDFGPVREQVTATTTLQITQPITPLYQIYKGYKAAKLGERAARRGMDVSRQDIVAGAKKAYIQLKQAEGGVKIAGAAVAQVNAQLKLVRAFNAAGLSGRNDVLKVEVGLAQARGAQLKARVGLSLARSALALAIGLPPATNVVATEVFTDPPPPLGRSFDQCLAVALKNRPELKALDAQVAALDAGKDAAWGGMLPTVAVFGAYQRSDGMGFAAPKNAFFAGASLRWSWTWGQKYYAYSEARAKLASTKVGIKQLRDGIYLGLRKAYLELQTARQSLAIARVAVKQAEENYRIEKTKFEKASATTTDLLDAQLALTRTQQTYNNALFGWYLAHSELDRAMGVATGIKRR